MALPGDHPCASTPATWVGQALHGLTTLNLSHNNIADWSECRKLSEAAGLQSLLLNHNPLTAIEPPAATTSATATPTTPFAALQSLSINHTAISAWTSIDALDHFSALQQLRVKDVPVLDGLSPGTARQVLVARISKLRLLNGSEVRPRERTDSERAYVKWALQQHAEAHPDGSATAASGAPPSAVEVFGLKQGEGAAVLSEEGVDEAKLAARAVMKANHPRYFALVAKFGIEAAKLTAAGTRIGNNIVKVSLRCMAASACEQEPVKKRFPVTMTVDTLRQTVARMYKTDVSHTTLSFRDHEVRY